MSQTPTLAFCITNCVCSSAARSASTARFRSVISVPELNVPTTAPSSSFTSVLRHSISRSSPDLVSTAVSTGERSPSITVSNFFRRATRERAGRQHSMKSRPSSSSSVHSRRSDPKRLTSVIRPLTSSASRITSAVSRNRCARSRSPRAAASASRSSVSAFFRLVMSRSTPVKIEAFSEWIAVIASSTGSSEPSDRIAVISMSFPISRAFAGRQVMRQPGAVPSRNRGGMIRSASGRPIASALV